MVGESLERLFSDRHTAGIEFYNAHNHHHRNIEKAPMLRIDVNDLFCDKVRELDDLIELSNEENESLFLRFWDWQFADVFNWVADDFKESTGYEMFPSFNGYEILCNIPIYALWERREELDEEISSIYSQYDNPEHIPGDLRDDIEEMVREIKEEIDPGIHMCNLSFLEFKKAGERLKENFNDLEWIIKTEDSGERNFFLDDKSVLDCIIDTTAKYELLRSVKDEKIHT